MEFDMIKRGRGRPPGSKNRKTDIVQNNQTVNILSSGYSSVNLSSGDLIPVIDASFVPFGVYSDLKKIIESKKFYPVYIYGLSGCGKTFAVEQACAQLGRGLIRVNVTAETDEDSLLGGFRLEKGETKWFDGPVVRAMKTGSVLLLDEVDLNSVRIMCLQPVLEGSGIFLKRINTFVEPKPGFNIIATANTKGHGSESGKFIGTHILNEAFLDRFALTFQQDFPEQRYEIKIIEKYVNNEKLSNALVLWANSTRQLYKSGGLDEIITTRRLVHVSKAYQMFEDIEKSIKLCLNRFDDNTKESFFDMFTKIYVSNENIDNMEKCDSI